MYIHSKPASLPHLAHDCSAGDTPSAPKDVAGTICLVVGAVYSRAELVLQSLGLCTSLILKRAELRRFTPLPLQHDHTVTCTSPNTLLLNKV